VAAEGRRQNPSRRRGIEGGAGRRGEKERRNPSGGWEREVKAHTTIAIFSFLSFSFFEAAKLRARWEE